MFRSISENFWTPKIWLPVNYTWSDLKSTPEMQYPNWNDVWTYPFLMALGAIVLRFMILNPYVFGPIASYYNLTERKRIKLPNIDSLERLFAQYKAKPPSDLIVTCAKEIEWPVRQVERWLRVKALSCKETKYKKFLECCWQLVYYTFIFVYGLWVMHDKNWMWDIDSCWRDYPHHSVSNSLWWYYMMSLAFYWAMVFTHFTEAKRKDFWQMFVHHLVTIALIVFSWACNFCRIGAVILVTHDFADIPLQLSKIFIYLKKKAICDVVFSLFALMWFLSRDVYFPLAVIRNTLFYATDIIPIFPAYYIFNGLLIALFFLHIFWSYFIVMMIFKSAVQGKIEDERSSTEESYSDMDADWTVDPNELINGHQTNLPSYSILKAGETNVRSRLTGAGITRIDPVLNKPREEKLIFL